MLMHTRKCMKIFLVCGICNKSYFSISGIAKHAEKHHDNKLDPKAKGQTSAMQTELHFIWLSKALIFNVLSLYSAITSVIFT